MDAAAIRRKLLDWYDAQARDLPWRIGPADRAAGIRPDPYRVWLSEVMLQQTTTVHAAPYFAAFTARWPTVEALAEAADDEVMAAWAGLGYYARARNLLACARAVAGDHGGRFPQTEAGLRSLPGLGAYTAAAVAAIAFDRPANVVDGNVERVMARLFAVGQPLPAARPQLRALADRFVTDHRPGDWAQALMDLGATVCRPRAPRCADCPLAEVCQARAEGRPDAYPVKAARAGRPVRHGVAFVLTDGERVAVETRPARGLLGGMAGLPGTDWRDRPWSGPEARLAAPIAAEWIEAGRITHVFTHFALELEVMTAEVEAPPAPLRWARPAELPTAFRKAVERALGQA